MAEEISARFLKSSRVTTGVPTSIEIDPWLSSIVPAGITKPFAWRALTIDCCESPFAASTSVFNSRFTRFSLTPAIFTSRTPFTCENNGTATSLSVCANFSLLPSLAETPKAIIGTESKLPERTLGSTSEGSELFIFASVAARSSATLALVVPYSNSTRTIEILLCEVEVEFIKPSIWRTASSITRLTWLSTTSGEAPGYAVTMAACGTSNEGMSSCFKDPSEMNPNTAVMIVISATTDRLATLSLARRNTRTSFRDTYRLAASKHALFQPKEHPAVSQVLVLSDGFFALSVCRNDASHSRNHNRKHDNQQRGVAADFRSPFNVLSAIDKWQFIHMHRV